MINLQEAQPADVIESSWLEEYERRLDVLWQEVVRLNSNLYILDKILKFRFDLFVMPDRPTFFNFVVVNLFEYSILTAWKLVEDTLTLRSFKNEIRQHIRCAEYKCGFDAALKEIKFQRQIRPLRDRIKTLRDKRIAHLDKDFNLSPQQIEEMRISLADLSKFRDALNQLFKLLCFRHQRSVVPIEYYPEVQHPPGVDARSDIERLLDNIARDSPLLNMPEEQPDYWPTYREQNLSKDDLQVLNKYRRKFGLPEV